jgi:hypothetical protein
MTRSRARTATPSSASTRFASAPLARAKERLDRLDWYPRPVRIDRVRVVVAPTFFRLPWLRRFDGYAAWNLILLRHPPSETSADLLTHELCHVWQLQHHPFAMPLSYLRHGYTWNPYEVEARHAIDATAGEPT